jgi:hypothetical protein
MSLILLVIPMIETSISSGLRDTVRSLQAWRAPMSFTTKSMIRVKSLSAMSFNPTAAGDEVAETDGVAAGTYGELGAAWELCVGVLIELGAWLLGAGDGLSTSFINDS